MTKDEIITQMRDIAVSGEEFCGAAVKAERIKAIAACAAFFFREPAADFENVSPDIIALSAFEVIKALAEEADNDIANGMQRISDTCCHVMPAEGSVKNATAKP